VVDRAEADKVLRMLPLKYPEQFSLPVAMPGRRSNTPRHADRHL
jgi:hypothetical protein